MISRALGAFLRCALVAWLVVTPALLLPGTRTIDTDIVALVAVFAALFTFFEYNSNAPVLIEFRDAPPFNRVRFLAVFATVMMLTTVAGGAVAPSDTSEVLTLVGTIVARAMAFNGSPIPLLPSMMPEGTSTDLILQAYAMLGLAFLTALVSLAIFAVALRAGAWPNRVAVFNMYINMPAFDPTTGGDLISRLRRASRWTIGAGLIVPFVFPFVGNILAETLGLLSFTSPQTLIWTLVAWTMIPTSLLMRGIAMARLVDMLEEERRKRYETVGEEEDRLYA